MKRRIDVTDGHGLSVQGLVHGLEVSLLEGKQLIEGLLTGLNGLGKDHLSDLRDTIRLEEHVLGTAKADTLSAKAYRILGILRGICIGTYAKLSVLVSPVHDTLEVSANGCILGLDISIVDLTGRTVQRDVVSLMIGVSAQLEILLFFVDLDLAASGYAAGSHTTGNNGCVRGHTASYGQDTLGSVHTLDVLRRGLKSYKDNSLALLVSCLGLVSSEVYLTCCSARGSGKCGTDHGTCLKGSRIEGGMQKLIQRLCVDTANSLFGSDLALVYQIAGDLDGCRSSSLTVTGLEEVQLSFLNGELHILHVTVMVLKFHCVIHELLIALRQILLQLGDGLRCADTCYDVLTLCIDQVLTVDTLLTGGGVSGEGNASTGGVAHVTEYHGLYVNSCSPIARDIVHTTVNDGTGVVPGTEYCLDSLHELLLGILGEVGSLLLPVVLLEANDQGLHIVGIQLNVKLNALCFLYLIDDLLEG